MRPPQALTPVEALLLVLLSLTSLLALGGALAARWGLPGIAISELTLVLLPTVVCLQARGVPLVRGLGLEVRRTRGVLGGALVGLGAFWLAALFESVVIERILPTPPPVREAMRRLVLPPGGPRALMVDVLVLAVLPAVCEEALFRGAVLGALRQRGTAVAVVGSAFLFGAYHASPYRFLPVALLGLLLGGVRVRSASLLPAVAFHAVHNTLVILLLRGGLETVPAPGEPGGTFGLTVAAITLLAGVSLLNRSQPR